MIAFPLQGCYLYKKGLDKFNNIYRALLLQKIGIQNSYRQTDISSIPGKQVFVVQNA